MNLGSGETFYNLYMKIKLLLALLLCSTLGFSQGIKLSDITNYLSKNTVTEIDKSLKSKGWLYYNDETSDVEGVVVKVWAYQHNPKTNKAVAWMSISYKDNTPLRALYEIFDYTLTIPFSTSTSANGFVFEDIKQDDKEFKKRYATSKYYLYEYQAKDYDKGYQFDIVVKSSILDARNGKKYTYYDDGQVKTEYFLKNDELNGLQKSYHENGNIKKEGNWVNDKESGLFKFYNEDGVLENDETYVNGVLEGPAHFYYPNGTMEYSCDYSYGKKNGLAQKYDENGKIISKTNYIGDKRFGEYTEYVNGQESFKCYYIKDELSGPYTETLFDEDDKPYATVKGTYKEGYFDGKIIGYYLGTKDTLSVRTYQNQLPSGEWRYYDKNKQLSKRMSFVNGHASVSEYFSNGKVTDRIEMKSATDEYWFFEYVYGSDDSKVTVNYRVPTYELAKNYNEFSAFESETAIFDVESTLDSYYKYGFYSYENKVLIFSGNYNEENAKSGQWERFFKGQKVKSTLEYVDGEVAREMFYSKKGKPFSGKVVYEMIGTRFSISVKDGMRNGPTEEKDLETKEVSVYNYVNGELVN